MDQEYAESLVDQRLIRPDDCRLARTGCELERFGLLPICWEYGLTGDDWALEDQPSDFSLYAEANRPLLGPGSKVRGLS